MERGIGMMLDEDENMGVGVDYGNKLKRNRESTNGSTPKYSDIKQVYPLIRDHNHKADAAYLISLASEFILDPPKIAKFLSPVAVKMKREKINQLTHNITTGDKLEIEKCTKELGDLITTDPRLGTALEEHFYKLLVDFLCDEQNPVLQVNAILILIPVVSFNVNREMVIKYIKPSLIPNLLRSKDYNLMIEALWLLRSIVLAFSNRPDIKIKEMIEEALESMTSFITKHSPDYEVLCTADSVDYKVLCAGSMTLAAICQEHPQLPRDKFEFALITIINLLRHGSYEIASNACQGFAYLCDGNKEVIVGREDLNYIIDQLILLIYSRERANTLDALLALGSIARWGSDDDIQVIIDKKVLGLLESMLRDEDKYYVKDSCWILSNISARKENHIEAVIKYNCIENLVLVIKKHKLADVKEEAAWTILNAIHGANNDQIIYLRDSVKPLWDSLNAFSDDPPIVCACLESLVGMKWVEVTCNGEMVNDAEFKKILGRLKEKQVQLADDDDEFPGSPKLKRLCTTDDIGKYDNDIMFHLSVNSL